MFHHSNFILAFYAILLAILFVVFIRTDTTVFSSKQNTQYGSKLTIASHSAVQTLEPKKLMEGKYLWTDKKSREDSINAFYYSLAASFMQSTIDRTLQVSTPIVMLVDTDGYYIGYNALFNWDNLADPSKENNFENAIQMTSLTAWGEEKYGYYVRYYLGDKVGITTPSGKTYEGERHNVAALMQKDGISGSIIDYLNGNEKVYTGSELLGEAFIINSENLIVNETEATLQRYINEYNYNAGMNGGGYQLTMPDISGEMWHRLLQNPTFISFLQGNNVNNGKEVINTYAYSGGEVMKADKYFMTDVAGHKVYHSFREGYSHGELVDNGDGTYTFNGHTHGGGSAVIDKLYFSMGDCAAQGAVPCPDCIR